MSVRSDCCDARYRGAWSLLMTRSSAGSARAPSVRAASGLSLTVTTDGTLAIAVVVGLKVASGEAAGTTDAPNLPPSIRQDL